MKQASLRAALPEAIQKKSFVRCCWIASLALVMALMLFFNSSPVFAADCLPATIRKHTYRLELAATPEARTRGLMNRDKVGPCDGMAFFFPTLAPQKFWMKNTRIPLDMLFVDERNTITAIVTGKPQSEEQVGPDTPVATVIEIDGGRASRDGIAVGDRVHYEIQTFPSHLAK